VKITVSGITKDLNYSVISIVYIIYTPGRGVDTPALDTGQCLSIEQYNEMSVNIKLVNKGLSLHTTG
jgi:hypothetical protein